MTGTHGSRWATTLLTCAWVLWWQFGPDGAPPLDAFTTKAECEVVRDQKRALGWTVICLPDTIDPRTPKAK